MTYKLLSILLFFWLLGGGAMAAADVVYKWTDEQGEVHFSDRPHGERSRAIDLKVAPRYPSSRQAESGDDAAAKKGEASGGKGGRREVADANKQQEIRRENCEKARKALERNKNLGRMYRVDADGERHYLSDKEREGVMERSRSNVSKWCD